MMGKSFRAYNNALKNVGLPFTLRRVDAFSRGALF